MNFVHIVGRLAKDPETRFTAGGQKVTTFVVATNSFKGGNEETIWWRVTLWGDRYDKMLPHLNKGKPVMIGGEMRKPETYTDKSGLTQVGSIEITAEYVKFVPFGRPEQGEEGSTHTQGAPKKQAFKSSEESFPAESAFGAPMGFSHQGGAEDDNLPF